MSTKTISKRVALATVVALGAGVLSLVSVSSANAYAGVNDNNTAGSTSTTAAAGILNIGTTANTTGSAVLPDNTGNGSTASSVGLVTVGDLNGGRAAATTATATLLSTGKLVVYTSVTSTHGAAIAVTGGTLVANNDATAINSGATVAVGNFGTFPANLLAATITPSSGASSMTVYLYDTGSTVPTTSNYTAGTLAGQIVVTIAASSTAGTVSTAKSAVWYAHAAAGVASLTADDTTTATEANPNGGTGAYSILQFANIRVRDAYGTSISSSSGLLTASATNGAYINLGSAATTATQSTAFYTGNGNAFDNSFLTVKNPTSAALSTTVTVSYNGVVIGTKSFTFTGNVAKVILSAPTTGTIGAAATSTGTATIAFADSAGNAVYPSTTSTAYPAANLITDAGSTNAYVTGGAVYNVGANNDWPTSTSAGVWQFNCGPSAGSANVVVKYSNNDGTVTSSNALPITCAGSAATYTAALDKTTYAPGDIAILKVTFKDSKGNLAADAAGNIASSTSKPSLSGGNLSLIGGTDAATGLGTDTTTNGVATYKFVVGAPVIDPYGGQLVVSFGVVNAGVGVTQNVSYKIASGSTSLNDVLKGIVSLIASINKQIAALAKLVTKK